jgi:hypothetical protein
MGTNLPRTIPDLYNWANAHATLWQGNAASIGLTPAQATAFKNFVTSFGVSRDAAEGARLASKNATEALGNNVDNVRTVAGQYVNLIKAFAESTNKIVSAKRASRSSNLFSVPFHENLIRTR